MHVFVQPADLPWSFVVHMTTNGPPDFVDLEGDDFPGFLKAEPVREPRVSIQKEISRDLIMILSRFVGIHSLCAIKIIHVIWITFSTKIKTRYDSCDLHELFGPMCSQISFIDIFVIPLMYSLKYKRIIYVQPFQRERNIVSLSGHVPTLDCCLFPCTVKVVIIFLFVIPKIKKEYKKNYPCITFQLNKVVMGHVLFWGYCLGPCAGWSPVIGIFLTLKKSNTKRIIHGLLPKIKTIFRALRGYSLRPRTGKVPVPPMLNISEP